LDGAKWETPLKQESSIEMLVPLVNPEQSDSEPPPPARAVAGRSKIKVTSNTSLLIAGASLGRFTMETLDVVRSFNGRRDGMNDPCAWTVSSVGT